MCIAIYKPKGQTIDDKLLKECWENNSDGAGFMWALAGKIILHKGYMSYAKFLKAWRKQDTEDRDVILHFRIKTSGKTDQSNCHPHLINQDVAVVHNGIFSIKDIPLIDKGKSDTIHFCRILKKVNSPDFLKDKEVQKWISKVSFLSKLIFLRSSGEIEIVNEEDGEWTDGVWYSNCSYKYPAYYTYSYADDQQYEAWTKGEDGEWAAPVRTTAQERCDVCGCLIVTDVSIQYSMCKDCIEDAYYAIHVIDDTGSTRGGIHSEPLGNDYSVVRRKTRGLRY